MSFMPNSTVKSQWESKALLKGIVEAFDGLIYLSSDNYHIEYINEKLIKRKGYDIGKELCFKALHGRDDPCPFCVKEQVLNGGIVSFEVRDPRDHRWYLSVNSPVFHRNSSIFHLSMITDIHERKMAEISLKERTDKLWKENLLLKSNIKQRNKFGNIIGRSVPMQAIYEQILTAAATDATIIIYGEPGTGKELVARAIHDMSERRQKQFVPVHCGAILETLIESEFFGHKKGAFTGAFLEKRGYIDYADGGTLFLDEIGEISLSMQVKLLRVIEGGGYTPVGSNRTRTASFRIIAATNQSLLNLVEQGKMRDDFFYRIHIVPINLPPLRSRKEDIPLLINHFLHLHKGKENIQPLSDDELKILMDYDWPGNVRELQSVMIRYCARERIDLTTPSIAHAPGNKQKLSARSFDSARTLRDQVEDFEKHLIHSCLMQNLWHRGKTAVQLGIDRKTLFNKLKRYNLLEYGTKFEM
jgi:transcriptional regulator with PAS, ATPase and Fis domain